MTVISADEGRTDKTHVFNIRLSELFVQHAFAGLNSAVPSTEGPAVLTDAAEAEPRESARHRLPGGYREGDDGDWRPTCEARIPSRGFDDGQDRRHTGFTGV